ncbi:hypothetical protein Q4512_01905 [Oceanihabitans sp. 2_MG-2023]|uniref:hypothetical protein n=1 Tax=Oceanihabitans sp. 2_MG-2023 TaxID=3062661 RepID=UPI0026E3A9B6|nr:hypothetical protein [Oceanihabitans sp. 2_MG-2023]MDO6595648.1 hypothetical protein [Oceanihabitans sp. 2_MG-2023]
MKKHKLFNFSDKRNLLILLLFFSAYLLCSTNEKYLPIPYILIEIGLPIETIMHGFIGEFNNYLFYLLLLISHFSILFLIKKRTPKALSIFIPFIFIFLFFTYCLINNNIDRILKSSHVFYSMIPYSTLWLILIYSTYKKSKTICETE